MIGWLLKNFLLRWSNYHRRRLLLLLDLWIVRRRVIERRDEIERVMHEMHELEKLVHLVHIERDRVLN
jgi:hypothetical protein